jgi:4-hydroxy-3-methylbut-2-enyl diphosphate reductase
MDVIRAEVMGLCFGVRDALKVIAGVGEPTGVTIHGQLVHNDVVQRRLRARGFSAAGEDDRRGMPATPTVLITAHGVSDRERARLESAGKALLDTTCPLVERAHDAALRLRGDGFHVLLVGRPGHVEVRGIVEDLDRFDIIASVEDVRTYPSRKLGIVCQTTTPERLVARVREAVASKNPDAEIRFVDTVCLPTKEHQRSLERLLDRVEAVVVVGGKNSNNTRELAALCLERGRRVLHVEAADDLDPAWFEGLNAVGLTAGTSTLDETIDEVERAIRNLASAATGEGG